MLDRSAWFTIGHSTLPIQDFLDRLIAHRIAVVADVRRYPASRRHPHFEQSRLAASLSAAGIAYEWFEDLGGRRHAADPSPTNAGWRVAAFHAYADYLSDPRFIAAFERLERRASASATAVMCAEALWTKCHRRLIADAATARGWSVHHIMGVARLELHALPVFARVVDGHLHYPRSGDPQLSLFGV
ncbi:MAG: DUF488 domain-containing protein [Planctomycetes bacterium]|nr:DUF488 domain-containing protein [Planctomycetota bacterium]